jgi:glycosyltransferase involved in cell wall biosynthesis
VTTADAALRASLGLHANSRVFLSIGGIEPRKNTLNILRAFETIHQEIPHSQLIIAGGATLLDHTEYVDAFWEAAQSSHLNFGKGKDVAFASKIPDESMPSLYRIADALVFPSVKEGFGLVVLEALASDTPVILSRIAPFTEYMPEEACLWSDPHDVASIADAMRKVLQPETRERLRRGSEHVAEAFSWSASARVHAEHDLQVSGANLHAEFRDTDVTLTGAAHA